MDDSDDKLLKRLQQGDESAFVALLEQYHAAMRRAARLWVSTDASADEVVQDTWLGVLDALSSFEGQTSVETWIFQILVDRARAMRAREARLASVSASTENARHAGSEQETPTQLLLRKELAGELEAAMLDLSVQLVGQEIKLTIPSTLKLEGDQLEASGAVEISHRQLGLKPFSALLGSLRVAEQLKFKYRIRASKEPK